MKNGFKVGDYVRWRKSQATKKDRALVKELASEYGEGPFLILEVREIHEPPSHSQSIMLQISPRKKLPFSGKWLRRVK